MRQKPKSACDPPGLESSWLWATLPYLGAVAETESLPHCWNRRVLPIPRQVLNRCKGARLHAINVQMTVQVVDLMLQNARKPTRRLQTFRLALFVEAFDDYAASAFHQCAVATN